MRAMPFPGEVETRAERAALLETLDSLDDETFESGTTLCAEWAPRDILAHVMGLDTRMFTYAKHPGRLGKANQEIVEKARAMPRDRLMHRARHWAASPAPHMRVLGIAFLGDLGIHHQDILRGQGKARDVPDPIRAAILREGMMLGVRKLLDHRVAPTDGGTAFGRGQVVRGTSEALGLWLAGRDGLDDELERTAL